MTDSDSTSHRGDVRGRRLARHHGDRFFLGGTGADRAVRWRPSSRRPPSSRPQYTSRRSTSTPKPAIAGRYAIRFDPDLDGCCATASRSPAGRCDQRRGACGGSGSDRCHARSGRRGGDVLMAVVDPSRRWPPIICRRLPARGRTSGRSGRLGRYTATHFRQCCWRGCDRARCSGSRAARGERRCRAPAGRPPARNRCRRER